MGTIVSQIDHAPFHSLVAGQDVGPVPTLIRRFTDRFGNVDIPPGVRQLLNKPHSTFPVEHQHMFRWLELNVPQRLLHRTRCPDLEPEDVDDHDPDDVRIVEWLRTGSAPRSVRIVDDIMLDEGEDWVSSPSSRSRHIRKDESHDEEWWQPRFLYGPFRRWIEEHGSVQQDMTWFVNTLQPGAKVYHGTNREVTHQQVLARPNFFGDWFVATAYFAEDFHIRDPRGGHVLQFVVKRRLMLLSMHTRETITALLRFLAGRGERDLIRRVEVAFPRAIGGQGTRVFSSMNDVPLFQRLCTMFQVDGCAARPIMQDMTHLSRPDDIQPSGGLAIHDDDVPAEMFLCSPGDCLIAREHVWAAPWPQHQPPP